MRAYADNEDLALLSGINPERVVAVTWIIVAALATIAGVLYGLDKSFKPFTYFQLLLPSLPARLWAAWAAHWAQSQADLLWPIPRSRSPMPGKRC